MKEQNAKSLQMELCKIKGFAAISQKIQEWQSLQKIFQHTLDSTLTSFCRFYYYKKGCLVLATESAAWAAKVRYLAPNLIKTLKKHPKFSDLHAIKCMVEPMLAFQAKSKPGPNLSPESLKILQNIKQFLAEKNKC